KYTCLAPRLRASIPTAPVPANRSSQTVPTSAQGLPALNTLNSVSRKRSEVGRMSMPRSDCSGRLRYLPAMTRTAYSLCHDHSNPACRIKAAKAYAKLVCFRRAPVRGGCTHPSHLFHSARLHLLDRIPGTPAEPKRSAGPRSGRYCLGLRGGPRVRTSFRSTPVWTDSQGRHSASAHRRCSLRRVADGKAADCSDVAARIANCGDRPPSKSGAGEFGCFRNHGV